MSKLDNINNSFGSYQQIVSFYNSNKDKVFANISIELHNWLLVEKRN